MVKLIATDLDNTVLHRGRLVEGTKEAFEKAADNKIEVVVATGRGLSGVPKEIKEIKTVKYAITSNGACIHNIQTGKLIRQYTLSTDTVSILMAIGKEFDCTYEIFVDGQGYVSREYYNDPVKYGMSDTLIDYIHSSRVPLDDLDSFIEKHKGDIANFAYVLKTHELHLAVDAAVSKRCEDVYVTSSDDWWVEVMDAESGKGKGLKHICEYLGIDLADTAAFGDAENDLEMMEYAGYSFAVGNASPECKAKADYICDNCETGGEAKAIEEILLSKGE